MRNRCNFTRPYDTVFAPREASSPAPAPMRDPEVWVGRVIWAALGAVATLAVLGLL